MMCRTQCTRRISYKTHKTVWREKNTFNIFFCFIFSKQNFIKCPRRLKYSVVGRTCPKYGDNRVTMQQRHVSQGPLMSLRMLSLNGVIKAENRCFFRTPVLITISRPFFFYSLHTLIQPPGRSALQTFHSFLFLVNPCFPGTP